MSLGRDYLLVQPIPGNMFETVVCLFYFILDFISYLFCILFCTLAQFPLTLSLCLDWFGRLFTYCHIIRWSLLCKINSAHSHLHKCRYQEMMHTFFAVQCFRLCVLTAIGYSLDIPVFWSLFSHLDT